MGLFRNFLSNILDRNISKILVPFYQHAGLEKASWISGAVNKNPFAGSFLTKELEIRTFSDAFSLKVAETKQVTIHQLWKNRVSLGKGNVPTSSPLILEFNSLIDLLIEKKLLFYQQKLAVALSKTFTPTEISAEDKALEWMRVSFGLLEKAVVQSLTDPELLFQCMFFMGENPKTQAHEIRVIAFNLDINFAFLDNGLLRVHIYNDKSEAFGTSKKASLEGDFNFRKREMLDQLIKLLSVVARGIKLA